MSRELRTSIFIDAAPAVVWAVLVDVERLAEWNPVLTRLEGTLALGSHIEIELHLGRSKPMVTTTTISRWDPEEAFAWAFSVPLLLRGEHGFELHAEEGGTRFVHYETFSGIAVPFVWSRLVAPVEAHYRRMNEALKARAEG